MRKNKKFFALMLTIAFIFSIAVPAFAATENRVNSIVSMGTDLRDPKDLGTLVLKEDDKFKEDLKSSKSFVVTLPSGVKLHGPNQTAINAMVKFYSWNATTGEKEVVASVYDVHKSGDYMLTITLPNMNNNLVEAVEITPKVKIDGFGGGDIELTVDAMDSGVTGGKYVIGRVAKGLKTEAIAVESKTIGEGAAERAGDIRITESYSGALTETGDKTFELKLPSNFKWADATITGTAGFAGATFTPGDMGERTLKVTYNLEGASDRSQRGIINIAPTISASTNAKFGDVTVDISVSSGSNIDSENGLLIAKYADYGVKVELVGDVKEVQAGMFEEEFGKIFVKENIVGSISDNRKTRVDFPEWVKITKVEIKNPANLDNNLQTVINTALLNDSKGEESYIEFTIPNANGSTKREFEVIFYGSIKANASGDIKAVFSGRSGVEGEVVVAKAITPISVSVSEVKDVKIGIKEQPLGDIIITENVKEGIKEKNEYDRDAVLIVELSDGVWGTKPKVEVIEGNLDLNTDDITKDGSVLKIKVKSEGTTPSKIKLYGGTVDLDRTIAEGTIDVEIKGDAVTQNHKNQLGWLDGGKPSNTDGTDKGKSDTLDAGEFDQHTMVKTAVAKVVTPADANERKTATFKLGDNKMVINGVELSMDVAPYAANDRTYLPIRYVAKAVGVTDDNIMWNQADQSAVLVKGDRIIKLTLGSQQMLVNGVPMTMDVAPEVKSERIMLPIRAVAQALGCTVEWDAATQTVTVN